MNIKRLILAFALVQMLVVPLLAQNRPLAYQDLTVSNDVFTASDGWGRVIVQCHSKHELTFSSTKEDIIQRLTIQPTDLKSVKKNETAFLARIVKDEKMTSYHLYFRIDKSKFSNRTLNVSCTEAYYDYVTISLQKLAPRSSFTYRIYDPQDANDGTAFQEHNVKGQTYFAECNYVAAKQEFSLSLYCQDGTEASKSEVRSYIADCDTIMALIDRGRNSLIQKNYNEAAKCFEQASQLNSLDRYVYNQLTYCRRKLSNTSNIYYQEAENKYRNKEYEQAKELYAEVVRLNGSNRTEAERMSTQCELQMRKRTNTERYLGVELGRGDLPTTGFTYGAFRDKVDYYMSLRLDKAMLELARQNFRLDDHAKLDFTCIGLSIPVVKRMNQIFQGAWINVGTGVTVLNKYELTDYATNNIKKDKITQADIDGYLAANEGDSPSDMMRMKFGWAAAAELGVTVKIWRVALRGTFLKRIPITTGYKDNITTQQLSIGVGYCF